MKWFQLLIIFFAFSFPVFSEPIRLAVLPFSGEKVAREEREILRSFLETTLFQTGDYTIVDQEKQQIILENQNKSFSGLYDEESMVEMGQLLLVEQLCFGEIALSGSKYHLTVKFIDSETGAILMQDLISSDSLEELVEGMEIMVLSFADFERKGEHERFTSMRKNYYTAGLGVSFGREVLGGVTGRWIRRIAPRWEISPGISFFFGDGFGGFVDGQVGYFLSDTLVLSGGVGIGYHNRYYWPEAGTTAKIIDYDVSIKMEYKRWGISLLVPVSLSFVGLFGSYTF